MSHSTNMTTSDQNEITENWIIEIMPKLLSNKDKERLEAEKTLEKNYYEP